jgi:hypothetical protein
VLFEVIFKQAAGLVGPTARLPRGFTIGGARSASGFENQGEAGSW